MDTPSEAPITAPTASTGAAVGPSLRDPRGARESRSATTQVGRFVGLRTLSETSSFRVASARELGAERAVTLVLATEGDPVLSSQALDRLFEAHRDPPHPGIARATERIDGTGGTGGNLVVFDFPAVIDLDGMIVLSAERGHKLPYAAGDGFTAKLREALLAGAARTDPETGAPQGVGGTLALANVVLAADGSHAVIGLGHNVATFDERHRLVARGRVYQAPEVAVGAPATQSSDLIAMIQMTRGVLSFVTLDGALVKVLAGLNLDSELARVLARFEIDVVRSSPANRLPVPEILALSQRVRDLLGVPMDPPAFAAFVRELVRGEAPDLLIPARPLEVAADSTWFALDGVRTEFGRSRVLGPLLVSLARARLERPGTFVPIDTLLAAVWAGERMTHASGRNRLYVAINALRKAGLGDHLESDAGGYRLGAGLRVQFTH